MKSLSLPSFVFEVLPVVERTTPFLVVVVGFMGVASLILFGWHAGPFSLKKIPYNAKVAAA